MKSQNFLSIFVFVVVVGIASLALSQVSEPTVGGGMPLLTEDNQGSTPRLGRLIVSVKGPVTPSMLAEVETYSAVHGYIPRFNLIVATPKGPSGRAALERLTYVKGVENDQPRWMLSAHNVAASWDRDILDVSDVQESGIVGAPDPREVAQTGAGVHVAVIDTGLIKEWRSVLVESRVRTDLAQAFMGGGATAENFVPAPTANPDPGNGNLWERDTNSHGTAVASHVIGFKIGTRVVDGTAPGAKVIPLKVFPNGPSPFTWASHIIAALAYVTELKEDGVIGPTVVNISIGGGSPNAAEHAALQDAIAHGLIIVVAAGNAGESGMSWPGAFPEVISAGATGYVNQFRPPVGGAPNFAAWWTQDVGNDPDGSGTSEELQSFVASFSGRARPDRSAVFGVAPQELDVLAPGYWTVAPGKAPGFVGFFFWTGTSFASPLTAGVAALMLEKNPSLTQADVESIMKSTALAMAANDSRMGVLEINGVLFNPSWDTACSMAMLPCNAVGAGLLQADAALAAVP